MTKEAVKEDVEREKGKKMNKKGGWGEEVEIVVVEIEEEFILA